MYEAERKKRKKRQAEEVERSLVERNRERTKIIKETAEQILTLM